MTKNEEGQDREVMREWKRETEELIRLFDEVFLQSCGILWQEESKLFALPARKTFFDRLWPTHK